MFGVGVRTRECMVESRDSGGDDTSREQVKGFGSSFPS